MNFDEPWDMGHKPGYEFWKHQKSAKERGISRILTVDVGEVESRIGVKL